MKLFALVLIMLRLASQANAAEVQIVGIQKQLSSSLKQELEPRLVYIKQRPASAWRADDAAFFLKRILIRRGYVEAIVTPSIRNENLILLQCQPGPRLLFGRVYAPNLSVLDAEQVDNYFMQPLIDREQVRRSEVPYQDNYAKEGASNIENYLKSLGYWMAKVTVAEEKRNATSKLVDVKLNIKPGVLHTMAPPIIKGPSADQKQQLARELQPFVGKKATSETIIETQKTATHFFKSRGYQYAQIRVDAKAERGQQQLTFNIQTGEIFKVRKVRITGNKKTRSSRLERYIQELEGEYYDSDKTTAISSRLLRTGAFKSVVFSSDVIANNEVDLLMEIEEDRAQLIRGYAGYGSFEKGILGLSYSNLNIMGRLQRLNIRGEYSGRGVLGEVNLIEPFFLGKPIHTEARTYLLHRLLEGYDKNESGYELSFSWNGNSFFKTQLYGKMNYANISSVSLSDQELGPKKYLNSAMGIRQTIDFRDDPVLPTKGFHLLASAELGSVQGSSYADYFRGEINSSYRMRLAKDHGLKFSFDIGTIKSDKDLPIDLKFFSGGANSVRSFREQYMGAKSDSGYPLGGLSYWNASTEYHYNLNQFVTAIGFVDAGELLQKCDVNFDNPSVAAGIGLHLNLPIGPIRLEYGKGISNNEGDPEGELHFSIGTSF